MRAEADPEFGPIAERIHANVGRQGFMNLVGAELSELSRGTCTIAVRAGPSCSSSTASSMAASPPSWSTTPRRSQRRPRAASRR